MDYNRIIANFFVGFFTALTSAFVLGNPDAFLIGICNAIILGGLASAIEWKKECENGPGTITQTLDKGLIV